ncbi:MAG: type II toxin-antitoxin system death-on-curing family toxin [Candidatus Binatia bacterium]
MRYLTLDEVLGIYRKIILQSSGSFGIRDLHALESSLAQPRATFGGADLYPTVAEKASALGFSLIQNHPFVDGNKRIGHAALETFLVINGYEINASVDDQEQIILMIASGKMKREEFATWLQNHVVAISQK